MKPIADGMRVRYNWPIMHLLSLSLTNYRNFKRLELPLPEGLVVFSGENGQGKSNLLEAIYLLALARSYRASQERELLAWDVAKSGGFGLIQAKVSTGSGPLDLWVGMEVTAPIREGSEPSFQKRIRVNGVPRRASDMLGQLNAVMFSAEDIDLIYGSPELRRRYLDVLLSQRHRGYLHAWQRYQRTLTQRNHLLHQLKEGRAREDEMAFWDESLCMEGARLLAERLRALQRLSLLARDAYARLAGNNYLFHVSYAGTVPCDGEIEEGALRAAFGHALQQSRQKERRQSITVVGPHRDDLRLIMNGSEMSKYASRGQARLAALSLRLAEGEFLTEGKGDSPVLLLDDVFSELDERRRSLVMDEAQRYTQSFITTTDAHIPALADSSKLHWYRIVEGQVIPGEPVRTGSRVREQ